MFAIRILYIYFKYLEITLLNAEKFSLSSIATEGIIHKIKVNENGLVDSTFECNREFQDWLDNLKKDKPEYKPPQRIFDAFKDIMIQSMYKADMIIMMKYITSSRTNTLPAYLREVEINSKEYIKNTYDDPELTKIEKAKMIAILLHTIKDKELLFGLLSTLYYLDIENNLRIFRDVMRLLIDEKSDAISSLPLMNQNDFFKPFDFGFGYEVNCTQLSVNFNHKDIEIAESMSVESDKGNLLRPVKLYLVDYLKSKDFKPSTNEVDFLKFMGEEILLKYSNFIGYHIIPNRDKSNKGELFLKRTDGSIFSVILASIFNSLLVEHGFITYHIPPNKVNEVSLKILELTELGIGEVFRYIENHIRYDYFTLSQYKMDVMGEAGEFSTLDKDKLNMIKNIRVSEEGDVKFTIRDKLTHDHYKTIHQIITEDIKSENIESLKSNLAYLFSIICVIEKEYTYNREIDKKSDAYMDMIKLRTLFVNDFKAGFRKVKFKDRDFNFVNYYEGAGFDSTIYTIDNSSIKGIRVIFNNLMIN